ncbi:MAG TPA: hypothetical protein VHA13_05085, partial [Gammaproteobacteria bacterium]|nr:hypothetical protein [Gammaproteobacteria bacterium]
GEWKAVEKLSQEELEAVSAVTFNQYNKEGKLLGSESNLDIKSKARWLFIQPKSSGNKQLNQEVDSSSTLTNGIN